MAALTFSPPFERTAGGGAPAQAISLTALAGLSTTVGASLSFSAALSNPTSLPLVGTPETASGLTGTPSPGTVTWALGDLNKAFTYVWAAAGSSSIRVRAADGTLSNTLPVTIAPAPSPTPPPPPSSGSQYRTNASQLFVDVDASSVLSGGSVGGSIVTPARGSVALPSSDFIWGGYGPSAANVEQSAGWAWLNSGGDWLDSTGAAQGSSPHFSSAANSVTSGSASYTFSATTAAQAAFKRGKWNAWIVRPSTGGQRSIAALHHPSLPAPVMNVTYADATTATLACLACVQLTTGSAYTQIGATESAVSASVALEFEMPTKAVTSATITWTVSQHDATACALQGFLANPPVNPGVLVAGGLSAAYPLDAGITGHSAVLFAQRYADGSVLSDFIAASPANVDIFQGSNWDPGLRGLTDDITKLPTAISGVAAAGSHKWFTKQSGTVTLVDSSYTGEGFVPFGPGLGALRILIPGSSAADGAVVGYGGSLACDLIGFLPKAIAGLLADGYVRFPVQFAWAPKNLADTKMYRGGAGDSAQYTVPRGKFGVGFQHITSYGGYNNTGGNNLGHSNRLGYLQIPADAPLGGVAPFVHSQDMAGNGNMAFGKDGGRGAAFYPNRTYWIEVRCKLNSWNPGTGVGSADGRMEVYIDDVLDSVYTGWKYRDGALDPGTNPHDATHLAPFREMGFWGLWLNVYNGGTLPPDYDQVMFIGPMVAATQRIGQMASAPAWVRAMPLNTWAQVPAGNTLASLDVSTNPTYTPPGADWVGSGMTAGAFSWTGMCFDQSAGVGYYPILGGHHDYGGNDTFKVTFGDTVVHSRLKYASGMLPGPAITAVDGNESTGVYSDGGLRTTHGYNNSVAVPGIGPVLVRQVGTFWNPLDVQQVWSMDPTTGVHTLRADYSALTLLGSGEGGCDYDPVRDCVWAMGQATSNMIQIANLRAGTWTVTKRGTRDNWLKSGGHCKYVPTLDRLVLWPANNGYEVVEFNPATYGTVNCATSGSFSAGLDLTHTDQPGAGMTWCPPLGCFLIWHNPSSNRTQISTLTPPATAGGTWVKGTLAVSGSNTVTPSAARQSGTFGRLAYSNQLGGVLLNNGTTEPTYFFRIV